MSELVTQSEHALNGFVLVIVGAAAFPAGLYVGLYDQSQSAQLHAVGERNTLSATREDTDPSLHIDQRMVTRHDNFRWMKPV